MPFLGMRKSHVSTGVTNEEAQKLRDKGAIHRSPCFHDKR